MGVFIYLFIYSFIYLYILQIYEVQKKSWHNNFLLKRCLRCYFCKYFTIECVTYLIGITGLFLLYNLTLAHNPLQQHYSRPVWSISWLLMPWLLAGMILTVLDK